MLDLTRVPELTAWSREDGWLRVGSAMPYTRLIAELGDELPGLAIAARTVGSPQIRNRGTVGGNLAQASPAGDALPPLYAANAEVELASRHRHPPRAAWTQFITGPKRNAMREDELIAAFWIKPNDGQQEFAKVGTRNAMVIAVCSFALERRTDESHGHDVHRVGRSDADSRHEAEAFIAGELDWETPGPLAATRGAALRRARRRRRPPDRRRPRHRGLPPARAARARPARAHARLEPPRAGDHAMKLAITINGERREADGVWEGQSLLNALRETTSTSPAPRTPASRASAARCSVYLDGTLVCSCLVLAAQAARPPRHDGRGHRRRRAPARRPAGDGRRRRRPVRLLHARASSSPRTTCCSATPTRPSPRSARRSPATSAAARATRRSSTPSRSPRRPSSSRSGGMSAPTIATARDVQRPGVIGTSTKRVDGVPKVRGEFEYSSDMRVEGMLHGATLRSPHPRARHLVDRHQRGADDPRRPRRAHPRGRPRPQDLRDGDRRPARAGLERRSATRASRSRSSPPTTPRPPVVP